MDLNHIYLLLIFAGFLLTPVFFWLLSTWLENKIRYLIVLTQKTKVSRAVSTLLFIVFVSLVISFWLPGAQWADSPYLFVIMAMLSFSWASSRIYTVVRSVEENRILRENSYVPISSSKKALCEILSSFFWVSLALLCTVTLLVFIKGKENSWIFKSYPVVMLSLVLILTSALLGGSLLFVTKNDGKKISTRLETLCVLIATIPRMFSDDWLDRIVSLPLHSLSLWGVLFPSVCFFIISGVFLQRAASSRLKMLRRIEMS